MTPNDLQQWLALYDQNNPGGGYQGDDGGFSMTQGAVNQRRSADAYGNASQRMNWAQRMLQMQQQGQPSNMGGMPPGAQGYVAPQQFNPQRPDMPMQRDAMYQPTQNYLMRFLGGR